MITEDYVSFETAKLLKEKGFDESFFFYYRTDDEVKNIHHALVTKSLSYNQKYIDDEVVAAPTLQIAMKWLREVHNIHIEIGFDMGYFPVCISTLTNKPIPYKPMQGKPFTYEEACEAAIKYCLENLI